MEDVLKKLTSIENEIKSLHRILDELGKVGVHNFNVLNNKLDEKINLATKEIISALKK